MTAIGKTTNVQTAGREGWFWYCVFNFFVCQHWYHHVLFISMCTHENHPRRRNPRPEIPDSDCNPSRNSQFTGAEIHGERFLGTEKVTSTQGAVSMSELVWGPSHRSSDSDCNPTRNSPPRRMGLGVYRLCNHLKPSYPIC